MTGIILRTEIPDLSSYEPESIDLAVDYWSPEQAGEVRRMYFMGTRNMLVPDQKNKEQMVELSCAIFVQVTQDGTAKTVANGSIRLVSMFAEVPTQTPVQVTYLGKKKNRTNGNQSAQWSVVTLKEKTKGTSNAKS